MYIHSVKIQVIDQMNIPKIRAIEKKDNIQIAKVIRSVLEDFGVPKVGTAYADKALDKMYETYDVPRSSYFVVEVDNIIIGGAGIAPLENFSSDVCELQKMYFLPEARGRGIGTQMMEICLNKAREFEFSKCYLETMPYMSAAQKLYKNVGFSYLDGPLGNTGHYACPVHMIKEL